MSCFRFFWHCFIILLFLLLLLYFILYVYMLMIMFYDLLPTSHLPILSSSSTWEKKNCLFCVHNFICWLSLCWKSSTLRWQQKKAEFKAFTCYDRDLLKSNFHYHSTKCLPSISYCYYYCLLSSLFVDFVVFTWII